MRNRRPTAALVACYARCSTAQQAERDESTIDAQIAETTRHAREVLGCPDPRLYVDEGRTGTNLQRPAWERLLADARAGTIGTVVTTYRSRLGRGEAATVASYLLAEAGVKVVHVHEDFGTDRRDRFVRTTVDTLASGLYVEAIREATTSAMEEMVRRGYWTGGRPRFGYRAVPAVPGQETPKRLVIVDEEAAVVRGAYAALCATGRIADAQRHLRRAWPDIAWPYDMVRRLLTSRLYLGELRLGRAVNPEAHEGIVTPAVFARAGALLQERGAAESATRAQGQEGAEREHWFPLRGLATCAHCGCLMTPATATTKGGRKVPYYECSVARKAGKGHSCPSRRINADHLLAAILSEVQRCAEHPTRLRSLLQRTATVQRTTESERVKTTRRAIREATRRIDDLTRRMSLPGMPDAAALVIGQEIADLTARRGELEDREDALLASLTPARVTVEEVGRFWGQIADLWPHVLPEQRREMAGILVQSITVTGTRSFRARLRILSPGGEGGEGAGGGGAANKNGTEFIGPALGRFSFQSVLGAGGGWIENPPPVDSAPHALIDADWSDAKCPRPKFP